MYTIHIAHITYDVLCFSSFHSFLRSWEVHKLLKVLLISMPLLEHPLFTWKYTTFIGSQKFTLTIWREGKFPPSNSFVKIIAIIFNMILSSMICPHACSVSSYLVLQWESVFFFLSYRKTFTNDSPRWEMEDNFIYDRSLFKCWKIKGTEVATWFLQVIIT